jgi:hypothetical protein
MSIYTVVRRFHLVRLIDCLAQIMAKRQVTDCLPFSV